MKPTYQIHPLSLNSNYNPINITATTAVNSQIIHTSSATDVDEIWLEAYNYGGSDALLSIAIGGTNPHQIIQQIIPPGRGMVPIIRGNKLSGGVPIRAFSSVANTISVLGYVHRIIFI